MDTRFLRGGSAGSAGADAANGLGPGHTGQQLGAHPPAFAVKANNSDGDLVDLTSNQQQQQQRSSSITPPLLHLASTDDVSLNGSIFEPDGLSSARDRVGDQSYNPNPVYRTQDAQEEILQLQMALHRNSSMGGTNGSGAKLVSGSQFRSPMDRRVCDACSSMHDKVKKAREVLRTCKLQLGRSEEKVRELEKIKEAADRLQSKLLIGGGSLQEDKVVKIQAALEAKAAELASVSRQHKAECDAHTQLSTEHSALLGKLAASTAAEQGSREEASRLRDALSAADQALDARKKALEAQKHRYEALLRDARTNMNDARERDAREASLREELANAVSFARDLEERLAARERTFVRDSADLKSQVEQGAVQLQVVKEELTVAHTECEVQSSGRNRAECQVADLEQDLARLRTEMETARASNEGAWDSERAVLTAESVRLKTLYDDLLERLQRDSAKTTAVLALLISYFREVLNNQLAFSFGPLSHHF
jgi:DNA repair exonuclease SbcCD ATPase subunit